MLELNIWRSYISSSVSRLWVLEVKIDFLHSELPKIHFFSFSTLILKNMPLCGVCLCKTCAFPLLTLILKTLNNMPLKKRFGTISGRDQKLFCVSFLPFLLIRKNCISPHKCFSLYIYFIINYIYKISHRNFISLCNFTSRTQDHF